MSQDRRLMAPNGSRLSCGQTKPAATAVDERYAGLARAQTLRFLDPRAARQLQALVRRHPPLLGLGVGGKEEDWNEQQTGHHELANGTGAGPAKRTESTAGKEHGIHCCQG